MSLIFDTECDVKIDFLLFFQDFWMMPRVHHNLIIIIILDTASYIILYMSRVQQAGSDLPCHSCNSSSFSIMSHMHSQKVTIQQMKLMEVSKSAFYLLFDSN